MKLLLTILTFLFLGSASGQTVHTFIGTGETEVRIQQPGYADSNLYETYFATPYAIAAGDTIKFRGTFARVDMYGYRGTPGQKTIITYDSAAWIKRGLRGYDLSDVHVVGAWDERRAADSSGAENYFLRFGFSPACLALPFAV